MANERPSPARAALHSMLSVGWDGAEESVAPSPTVQEPRKNLFGVHRKSLGQGTGASWTCPIQGDLSRNFRKKWIPQKGKNLSGSRGPDPFPTKTDSKAFPKAPEPFWPVLAGDFLCQNRRTHFDRPLVGLRGGLFVGNHCFSSSGRHRPRGPTTRHQSIPAAVHCEGKQGQENPP